MPAGEDLPTSAPTSTPTSAPTPSETPSAARAGGLRGGTPLERSVAVSTARAPDAPPSDPDALSRPPAIVVTGLVRAFGAKPVLRGVDLTVAAGERLALLGPNGAGKTTLLRVLATLNRPDAGRVRVAGYDVAREAAALRRVVGYVGHQPYLYDELTALENLVFYARMYGVTDPTGRARALLARVGLASRAADRVRIFSRGQQQRLALARGVLHDPRVLLLDEPETGLDEAAIALLDTLLDERTQEGRTTLFTTHDLERALARADAVALLARGRIVYAARAARTDLATLRQAFQRFGGRQP
jgi:heme ABC exporter ATP-binding subunit CcmA